MNTPDVFSTPKALSLTREAVTILSKQLTIDPASATAKATRQRLGIKNQYDILDENVRWLNEYRYLLEHVFMFRLLALGEPHLIEVLLREWGLLPSEGHRWRYHRDRLHEVIQPTSNQSVRAQTEHEASLKELARLAHLCYAEAAYERLLLLSLEYTRLATSYHSEQIRIYTSGFKQLSSVFDAIEGDTSISTEIRAEFRQLKQQLEQVLAEATLMPRETLEELIEVSEFLQEKYDDFMAQVTDLCDKHELTDYKNNFDECFQKTKNELKINHNRHQPLMQHLAQEIQQLLQKNHQSIEAQLGQVIVTLEKLPRNHLTPEQDTSLTASILELSNQHALLSQASQETLPTQLALCRDKLSEVITVVEAIPEYHEIPALLTKVQDTLTARIATHASEMAALAINKSIADDIAQEIKPINTEQQVKIKSNLQFMKPPEPEVVPMVDIPEELREEIRALIEEWDTEKEYLISASITPEQIEELSNILLKTQNNSCERISSTNLKTVLLHLDKVTHDSECATKLETILQELNNNANFIPRNAIDLSSP